MKANSRTSRRFGLAAVLLLASPLGASFHFIRIVQVYGGAVTHPDAQYVELQMCAIGQNHVDTCTVNFFDTDGAEIGPPATFAADVPFSDDQRTILIATSSAQTLFGVVPDLLMPASLRVIGGKVCWEGLGNVVDCFGWGAFSALPDASIGTPFDVANGLFVDGAATRDISAGSPTVLECFTDDTNQSAADFDVASPAPRNNAGANGVLNEDHVFLHGFENRTTGGWNGVAP